MAKYLNGRDLADFIKVRQMSQVKRLVREKKITPRLKIFINTDNPVIDSYVRLKKIYGEDIGIKVEVEKHLTSVDELKVAIEQANQDQSTHGIIVQLPLLDVSKTDDVVSLVTSKKDVDGLSGASDFDSATAVAINWLLTGYNINLKDKKIAIVGAGRLVGGPLYQMWSQSNLDVDLYDEQTANIKEKLKEKSIIVTGVGKPGLITNDMVMEGAVVVDAGATSDGGSIKGDVAPELYERDDIMITPIKGGVGPLTVAALFDHVILVSSTA